MTDEALKGLLDANAAEMTRNFDAAVARVEERFDGAVARIESTAVETLRHFEITVERLETKIQLVAETVGLLDESSNASWVIWTPGWNVVLPTRKR